MEHELADVGERGGVASGNAVLGDGGEEFAKDEVDVRGGKEIATDGGSDFCANLMRFTELMVGAGVEGAEIGVIVAAKHAAAPAVGEGELAERRFGFERKRVLIIGIGAFCGHGSLGK